MWFHQLFIDGNCKYGDRCTFAHGDQDMRSKFIKAEVLYSSAGHHQMQDPSQMMDVSYIEQPLQPPVLGTKTIDYSAFSAPPSLPQPAAGSMVFTPHQEMEQKTMNDFDSDFSIPTISQNAFNEEMEEQNPFFKNFNYSSMQEAPSSLGPVAQDASQEKGEEAGFSKFGFQYEQAP